jgi:hypothetical protein
LRRGRTSVTNRGRGDSHGKDSATCRREGTRGQIGDLVSAVCEKLAALSTEWFELNDQEGLRHARRMLDAKEVSLMLSMHMEESGLAHIALHLLRTETPMPRPFFEVRVPMLHWTLNTTELPLDATPVGTGIFMPESRSKGRS